MKVSALPVVSKRYMSRYMALQALPDALTINARVAKFNDGVKS